MLNLEIKEKIKNHCLDLLQKKVLALQSALQHATEAANNETKSTAGDKHETGRAMMQLEQEKLGKQLKELNEQQEELLRISTSTIHNRITKGSLIETDNGLFFISVGIGKIDISGKTVYVISGQSPLGQKLLGLESGNTAELNGKTYSLLSVY